MIVLWCRLLIGWCGQWKKQREYLESRKDACNRTESCFCLIKMDAIQLGVPTVLGFGHVPVVLKRAKAFAIDKAVLTCKFEIYCYLLPE